MKNIIVTILLSVLFSCGNAQNCYIVRHAEKRDDAPNSVLSTIGHARALTLRDTLLNKDIDMIFVTPFERTQQTAKPLADKRQKPLLVYRHNAVDSIVTVLNNNESKNILLVGHSGIIPAVIEGLTGKKIDAIEGYDDLYIVRRSKNGVELIHHKYGNQPVLK